MIQADVKLPDKAFQRAWDAIKLDASIKERLVAQALLSLSIRQDFAFEDIPLHGLILLQGLPGTGKTTLARGLANRIAQALKPKGATFLEVDPHAMASSSLGRSQKDVAKLFTEVIPERAALRPCVVLLDEVEAVAVDRQRLSVEANPIDVHRATDAALAGIDHLARQTLPVVILATTNFADAVDSALLSRADWVETVPLPNSEARAEIIADTIRVLSARWPEIGKLSRSTAPLVAASEGLDGRRIRKAIISAGASSVEIAMDLNKLTANDIVRTLRHMTSPTAETGRVA
jgi:SpoVK/Ycf46/Vps4 family AAA+-type ATPase